MTTMAENRRRQRIAAALHDRGATFREIAELLEVSVLVAKNYVEPERYNARILVNKALADGHVEKPVACQDCGATPKRLHGHHGNYYEPYRVRWLCSRCHHRVHPGERPRKVQPLREKVTAG